MGFTYQQKIFSKFKPYEKMTLKYYPVPGCKPHQVVVGTERGKLLFDRYCNRPQKSHGLYWRTHQDEYQMMLEVINSR